MKLFYNKKFLLDLSNENAGYLLRQLKKSSGSRVKVSKGIITLQNSAALEVAEKELWELTNP